MSAYLCNASHIAAIARFLADGRQASHTESILNRAGLRKTDLELGPNVAVVLAQANLDSLDARYPGEGSEGFSGGNTDFLVSCAARARKRGLDLGFAGGIVQLLKALDCFEYQSCETGDAFFASPAYELVTWARKALIGMLPGYEAADWGWPEEKEPKTISLLDMMDGRV